MSDERLLSIVQGLLESQAKERKEQTSAYLNAMDKSTKSAAASLTQLRNEVRVLGTLGLLILGSLAGANVYLETLGLQATVGQPSHTSALPPQP